jgi:hypothetical protein
MNTRLHWSVTIVPVILLFGVAGCGSGVNEVLCQTTSAAGRTTLDIFLTELANALADAFDTTDTPPADNGDDGADDQNGDEGGDDANGGDVPLDDLTPDAANGETVYAANGCAPCHCDDGSGGCGAAAPGVVGIGVDVLSDYLGNGATHFGQGPLTDQELVDLEAYLGSL